MIPGPHVIAGIVKLDEEDIKYLREKLSGLLRVYDEAHTVIISVADLELTSYSERAIGIMGEVDEIIEEVKKIYSELDFRPYVLGFDFIGEENSKYKNTVN